MQFPNENLALLGLVLLLLLLAFAGSAVYIWVGDRIASQGGRVRVEKFGVPDLLLGLLIVGCLELLMISGLNASPLKIHDSLLVSNALLHYIVLTTICAFIHYRGIDLAAQFGLRAVKPGKVFGIAFLLLLAAYPVIFCTGAVSQILLRLMHRNDPSEQDLVIYFREALLNKNTQSIVLVVFTGSVIAPVVEEFIFRGYIYGIVKRYLGIITGILFNAALFAAVHMNLASFPALFILAICLTLAYEFTGSILVNMCMHSLFNLGSFGWMYYAYCRLHLK